MKTRSIAALSIAMLLVVGTADAAGSHYKDFMIRTRPIAYWRLGEASGSIAHTLVGRHPASTRAHPSSDGLASSSTIPTRRLTSMGLTTGSKPTVLPTAARQVGPTATHWKRGWRRGRGREKNTSSPSTASTVERTSRSSGTNRPTGSSFMTAKAGIACRSIRRRSPGSGGRIRW